MTKVSINQNIRLIALALILCMQFMGLPPAYAAGKTYYVDALNGSDANSGLSEEKAWQSAQKVAETDFSEGDRILFHAGQAFYNVSIVPNCDSLTFGAYGEGEKPVLSGGIQGGPWEQYADGIYMQEAQLSREPYLLKIGDKTYRRQTVETPAETAAGRFSYDAEQGRLYVGAPEGIAPGSQTQIQQTNHIFYINQKTHITISGLSMMMTAGAAVSINSRDSRYITVSDNEMAYAESYASDGSGINCSGTKFSVFSDNVIHDVYGDGIMLWNCEGNTVSGNRIWGVKRGYNTGGDGIQCAGKAGNAAPDNRIINNVVSMKDTDVGKGCIQQENGDNVYIAGNVCLYGSFGIEANSNYGIIENNICAYQGTQDTQASFNWTAGLYMSEDEAITGMVWRGNMVSNCRSYGFRIGGSGEDDDGNTVEYPRTGFQIYNNTIYSNGPAFSALVPFDGEIYNNIFYNYKEGQAGTVYNVKALAENGGVQSEHNIIYPQRTGFISFDGVGYDTLEVYRDVTGRETNSYAEDPLIYGTKAGFQDTPATADYMVYANSKAVGGGREAAADGAAVYPAGCIIGAVQTARTDTFKTDEEEEETEQKPVYQPGLMAYDGFAYQPTQPLEGMEGGAGFAGAWQKTAQTGSVGIVGTSSLEHSGIYTTGYRGILPSGYERDIADPERFVNGTYYISFLFQGNVKCQLDTLSVDGDEGWIYVQNTAKKNWQIRTADAKAKTAASCNDTQGLALLRLTVSDTGTSAALWVNPDVTVGEEGLGTPVLTDSVSGRAVPVQISLGPADTSGKVEVDEIRIADNFTAVLGQTTIYPEAFELAEFTLYSANGVVDGAVEPGAPVTAELILTNTPDRDREVVFYAAAAGADGRVLDVMERKNVIKAGTATQLQIPISFAGIPAERYRVSVYLWDGMRPLAEKRGYTAEE